VLQGRRFRDNLDRNPDRWTYKLCPSWRTNRDSSTASNENARRNYGEATIVGFLDLAAAAVIGSIIWSSANNNPSPGQPFPHETSIKLLTLAASFVVTHWLKNITLSFIVVLVGYAIIILFVKGSF